MQRSVKSRVYDIRARCRASAILGNLKPAYFERRAASFRFISENIQVLVAKRLYTDSRSNMRGMKLRTSS